MTRGFAVASAAGLAAAALVLVEPACSKGPFGMVDPAIWPIWLGEVREMQPLLAVFQKNPLTGAAIAAFPAAGVLATVLMFKTSVGRRDLGCLTTAAVFLIAVAVTIGAIRGFSYAIWFGMPLVAGMALRLFDALRLTSVLARGLAALLLTPMALSSGAIAIANANGLADHDSFDRPASKACTLSANYAALAKLPPGIVATDVSYGPFLLALTPHSVLAGPYHHLSRGIVAAYRSLALPPEQARAVLAENHVSYVMLCGPRPPDGLPEAERGQSLWPASRRCGAGLARAGRGHRAGLHGVPGEAVAMASLAETGHRTDEQYYEVAAPHSLGERLVIAARDRIYADFLRCCRPSATNTILDVGVSDVVNDGANMMERKYPHQHRITAAGLGDGEAFRAAYPQAAYRRIEANRPLPFADRSFDIAVSNAVLEHVGSRDNQMAFVGELSRVAKRAFISVPNRYFPVEHHTAIPLLHFWDRSFALACRGLGKSEWADQRNLILMSRQRLAALAPEGSAPAIGTTGIGLGPFSSNLYLFIDATSRPQGQPAVPGAV